MGMNYPMTLKGDDRQLIVDAVNQGIDAHLQGITDSSFKWVDDMLCGKALQCEVSYKDLPIIIRRLLEVGSEETDMLAQDIATTLEIDDLWLTRNDTFRYTLADGSQNEVSVFDKEWLEELAK
jgi:hypothetical protein